MSVEITAQHHGGQKVVAVHSPSGAKLATDAPRDNGGQGNDFSPTDLVATALGSCILTIMGLVAARHELDLAGARVQVIKEMVSHPLRRIGSLKTTVTFPAGLVPEQIRSRLETAAGKCPVHQSLHHDIDAPIVFIYEE